MDYNDIFDDDGVLAQPTMRGSANLDVQDYEGFDGQSSILDDGLQEDTPSRPGAGAAAATDVEGTDDFDMLSVPGGMDEPGMKQTTYGASPWGPGSDSGYRPYSQQRTDMSLRALGDESPEVDRRSKPARTDSMMHEPEVIDTTSVQESTPWDQEWHGNQNLQPSNAEIDPRTLYDRTSYEYNDSSQDTIGSGIFGMEEGVTWRPRDGLFANQYALPAYIAEEDELGVQQSAMWDSTADDWRVTQPSASGIALSRRVSKMKPPPSQFSGVQMRPEATGPRSHVEAFGRKAAACLVQEARGHHPQGRTQFLASAIELLGPGEAERCRRAADQLIQLGYRADVALEDAIAHCVMHAAVKDLTQKRKRNAAQLPRVDRMATKTQSTKGAMQAAAAKHLGPLTRKKDALKRDLGALYASPAAKGMGMVANGTTDAPIVNGASPDAKGVFTPRNLLLAGGAAALGYVLFTNRKAIAKNIKKLAK